MVNHQARMGLVNSRLAADATDSSLPRKYCIVFIL